MAVIRVVSYNIHKGRTATGNRESMDALKLGLYGLSPDLLFLQEVQGRNDLRATLDAQHELLGAVLRMDNCYGCNAIREHTDHGNALLSRFPILYYENEDISDHRLEQRGLLHAVVQVEDRHVHCLVVHLGLFSGGRSRQIMALVDRINRIVPEDEPLLIAGDFNDWNNRLAPIFVKQLGLYEVFSFAPEMYASSRFKLRQPMQWLRGARGQPDYDVSAPVLGVDGNARLSLPPRTFPSAFPFLRLDRIYQRGFAVRSARVLQGAPWKQISDHSPILTELELP
ncbi:endonuclease/exonuclease/phosphatase family protein [Paenalcaligenes niemegkensis]|uniref:endonuclease/exonuclease/phosphatase family protein n=1 Tax=Paenalcaligenes niemegkensis TaxID=2895469 RepID=UPI001EE7F2F4|nr:endonuclease/exonuclease/phosphatase family protein [Paenalcaligenes niemegkensis]MCQ9617730.1 endonuclease/exonuclease/phosphatase family protein [Paenalcaligenes niemegkensis]